MAAAAESSSNGTFPVSRRGIIILGIITVLIILFQSIISLYDFCTVVMLWFRLHATNTIVAQAVLQFSIAEQLRSCCYLFYLLHARVCAEVEL